MSDSNDKDKPQSSQPSTQADEQQEPVKSPDPKLRVELECQKYAEENKPIHYVGRKG